MPTPLLTIVARARRHLNETAAFFWSDDELMDHAIEGCQDLWKALIDTFADHFLTIDETNVRQPANALALAGVPATCFRVKAIEARALNGDRRLHYVPLDCTHPRFTSARLQPPMDASGSVIYYDLIAAGAPIAAPTILVAPRSTADVPLRLFYITTLDLTSVSDNPIPGHSDNAIKAWIVAYARAKEREDRSPDPEWLAIYATDKKNLLPVVTPRQDDEDDYADAIFEPWWED